jgi:hypothetical protein
MMMMMMMVVVMNSDIESGLHEGMTRIKIKFSYLGLCSKARIRTGSVLARRAYRRGRSVVIIVSGLIDEIQ